MRESESQDQFGDERPVGEKVFFVRLGKQTETKLWLLETKAAAAFGEIGFTPLSFLVENKGLGLINQLTRLYFKQKRILLKFYLWCFVCCREKLCNY